MGLGEILSHPEGMLVGANLMQEKYLCLSQEDKTIPGEGGCETESSHMLRFQSRQDPPKSLTVSSYFYYGTILFLDKGQVSKVV